jgi:hypothetical protein
MNQRLAAQKREIDGTIDTQWQYKNQSPIGKKRKRKRTSPSILDNQKPSSERICFTAPAEQNSSNSKNALTPIFIAQINFVQSIMYPPTLRCYTCI